MKENHHLPTVLWLIVASCTFSVEDEGIFYANDFEKGNLQGFIGAKVDTFQNSLVVGHFNNDGFKFTLENIPHHNYLVISFDLLIHDSWDGNQTGESGPDIWAFAVDPTTSKSKIKEDKNAFVTTFSNSECVSSYCLLQSYPNSFPFPNNPKTGISKNAQGLYRYNDRPEGTAIYNISKTIYHTKNEATLYFRDWTIQTNARYPISDESWSLDNLTIESVWIK